MKATRKSYPSDLSDAERAFLVPYLTLLRPDADQRRHELRDVLNALRYVVKTGCQWRCLPNDFPPWQAVYQQARRWLDAEVFEDIVHDLRALIRATDGRSEDPGAAIVDARTSQSTPESGGRAGLDGHKRKNGSKVHVAVDALGLLLELTVSAANESERHHAETPARKAQDVADEQVATQGIELIVVKLQEAKQGFVLSPRRWVVERTFGWLGQFRRLARDYERLEQTLAGWHWLAALMLMTSRFARL